ncbi:polysaccharide deacetylase family protein [Alkaliphilus peptidifermentans]|uniref:Peptidoglycan/xylan/chitin deacetylase, PgdA/CDA1 family n=1 Tax=Alkaliphilus peptidifermentans DSM 18978 TaxID=1120976 RepID=A0A1G5KN71_9FIRM|nr:polysaccharide deacetylase family protein [Alkaliphilus peptidifermentans]SCZ02047.1 Peptidoglycan/xylan/chitin deacetylase, PgdA/CDA1 family [Alkaliphilus peptidifermentans DSM 18978]
MKHNIKLGITITLLTLLFIGVLSFKTILPYQSELIVEAKDLFPEVPEQEPSSIDPVKEFDMKLEEAHIIEDLEIPIVNDENAKIAYLTFDDGPSIKVTPYILDILKEQNIQATFFVIGSLAEKHPDMLLRMQEEGHLISNHTYTHDYKAIYSTPQSLINELRKTDEMLEGILGDQYKSKIIRFPGGSFGEKLKPHRQAVKEAGYFSVDWNVLTGDAEGKNVSVERQLDRIKETLESKKRAVILMHDSSNKETTIEALPEIIQHLNSQGYVFKTLTDYVF